MPARERGTILDDVAGGPGDALFVERAGHVVVRAEDVEVAPDQAFQHEIDRFPRRPRAGRLLRLAVGGERREDEAGDEQVGSDIALRRVAQIVLQRLGESLHASLGHIVGGITGRGSDALLRACVDDQGRILVRDHAGTEGARAVDNAHQVDAEHILPVCLGTEKCAARLNASIVHQDMDASETLDDGALQRFEFTQLRHVRADRDDIGLSARGDGHDFACGCGQPVSLKVDQDDAETQGREGFGRGKADAGGGASDDGDMALCKSGMLDRHGQILSRSMALEVRAIWYPDPASSTWRQIGFRRAPLSDPTDLDRHLGRSMPLHTSGISLKVPPFLIQAGFEPRILQTERIDMALPKDVKKVVLAYSGGLDTSIILKWLQTELGAEVVTFTADLGQGEELEPARKKAEMLGIKEIFIEDVREEFVRDFVFPMFRANAVYEGVYLLGTSIARPLISKHLIDIAKKTGADAIAHGATGKGNDQVRFELSAYALNPDIKIIAPWRDWAFKSRTDLLAFAEQNQIPVAKDKKGEAPFSVDANLLHSSSEGKVLEDPSVEAPEYVHMRTISPEAAPDKATIIKVGFEKGDAVSINGVRMSPATLLAELNTYGRDNGIGRLDLVENRFVGMKSRGVYETPGGTILLSAHRAIESITLDRGAAHLKDEIMPRYAELIYYGFWFSPEREMLQALIDKSQEHVEGEVTLKLYKGNVMVIGRESSKSLYSDQLVTFEDDQGAYDQKDAAGFIKLNALRLRTLAKRNLGN